MKKSKKNAQKSTNDKKNQKKSKKIKKFVRGTSITIYYTYKSPVYVDM